MDYAFSIYFYVCYVTKISGKHYKNVIYSKMLKANTPLIILDILMILKAAYDWDFFIRDRQIQRVFKRGPGYIKKCLLS